MHPRGVGYFRWCFHCFPTLFSLFLEVRCTKNNILTHLPRGNSFSEIDSETFRSRPGWFSFRAFQVHRVHGNAILLAIRRARCSPSGIYIYMVYTALNWVINMPPNATYHLVQEPQKSIDRTILSQNNRVFM